jgi:acetyl esterase/lipase
MHIEKIRLYENREDVTLTTYLIDDSTELMNGKKRPAIIICPGGAYMSCSDREAEPVALRFAAMGYHTFVLKYSTYFKGKLVVPDLNQELLVQEHCQYPNPMRDIGKSMLIIKEQEEVWLIDTEKIAICGFSAGAHNCAMYATHWNSPLLTDYFQKPAEMMRPSAVILGYTLSDYIFMKNSEKDELQHLVFEHSNTAFLGNKNPDNETFELVSPVKWVTKNTPPMFLWGTASDELVPVQHTIKLADALAQNKVPFAMHIFEDGNHGLSLATQASAQFQSQIDTTAAKWVELAEKWLEKRFALPLTPGL